jgi:hypothetical protein
VDPELLLHVLEELTERAEHGDHVAFALLVIPPIIVLVLVGVAVVLAVYEEMWAKSKKRLR